MGGLLSDQLLGSAVLPNRLTGAAYHLFFNDLPLLLEQMPLHQWQRMWFIHEGAQPHFLHTLRQHLNWQLCHIQHRSVTYGHRQVQNACREISVKPEILNSMHLRVTKSWKPCWNAWEPHTARAVEIAMNITHTSAANDFWPYVKWQILSTSESTPKTNPF